MRRSVQAALLGALHGPAELLPVSSTAHVTLVPHLAGWPPVHSDPGAQKAFAVALHAGSLPALALGARPQPWLAALSVGPPAIVGVTCERAIEQRLSGPRAMATGLIAGAVLLALGEVAGRTATREAADAGPADALALGAAQTLALAPGVSRTGAAIAAARARGFTRDAAYTLSREAGLPVLVAATTLKAVRLAQGEVPPELRAPMAAGAAAALAAGFAARPLARRRPVWSCAELSIALGSAVLRERFGARHQTVHRRARVVASGA